MTLALVTAGTSAIGWHLVLALAGAGHDVAFTHLGMAVEADQLCAEVTALGARAMAREGDAADPSQVAAFHAEIGRAHV